MIITTIRCKNGAKKFYAMEAAKSECAFLPRSKLVFASFLLRGKNKRSDFAASIA